MANGEWRMANGEWANGRIGEFTSIRYSHIRYSLFAIRHSPFAIRHSHIRTFAGRIIYANKNNCTRRTDGRDWVCPQNVPPPRSGRR
ncbi:MAG TPA: hypothetical protein G4N96_13735, partial [Chloroflexi bacterium]|nr:hypothetical protein [Chloroflexota bacterium]